MENLVQAALQSINFAAIMPSMILTGFGMALLLIGVFSKAGRTTHIAWMSILGLIGAAIATGLAWKGLTDVTIGSQFGFAGHVVQDGFALFFNFIFIIAAALTILMSDDYLKREGYPVNEYYALILFATTGAMLMASGSNMMTIFLGLEVLSISLYVLAGFFRNDVRSNEAGLKYFLLGAFSTGFLLYGMALIYGVTGTTNLGVVGELLSQHPSMLGNPMTIAGLLLLSTGFLFKIGAVPFHMWTPDVYQGAPTPITAFMSAGPKAAAIAAFMRILLFAFPEMHTDWTAVLWVLAVLTMTAGNLLAIAQTDIKRMLAYSSISHAGYALVGLVAYKSDIGLSGILFYMLAYTFMNIGAFAVLTLAGKKGEANLTLDGLAGFGFKRPFLGIALTIFLFSLMGLPPTAGFTAKFYIFAGAVKADYIWLAVIGVLNSAVSLYYYLRVMVTMYFRDAEEEFEWVSMPIGAIVSIIIAIAGVLYLGLLPERVMEMARIAIF